MNLKAIINEYSQGLLFPKLFILFLIQIQSSVQEAFQLYYSHKYSQAKFCGEQEY